MSASRTSRLRGLAYGRRVPVQPRHRSRAIARPADWPLPAWVVLGMTLVVALRAPWFPEPLGNDEGGLLYLASEWHAGGPFPYGDYFLDRPPLLLLIFLAAAETAGAEAVRAAGFLAASALVVIAALIGRELGARRAGAWAAILAALMSSSLALGAVFTPAELLAAVPSAASVLLLLLALRAEGPRRARLAGAGALAVCALLVKQSVGDALVAGAAFLVAAAVLDRRSWRASALDAGAYLAGACVPLVATALCAVLATVPVEAIAYALVGFRLDGLGELSGSLGDLAGRLASRLLVAFAVSGMLLLAYWSLRGVRRLRERRVALAAVAGWGAAGTLAILLGGSYWQHYLIGIVPFVAVSSAVGLAGARPVAARWTAAALAVLAVGGLLAGPSIRAESSPDIGASAIGELVAERARPADTIYVLYSQPNIVHYSGLGAPYPYLWSLMVRTFPDAEQRLRALLSSPERPTWLVEWEDPGAYGLDQSGATARLIEQHYREVATACGEAVLLARGAVRPGPRAAADCGQKTFLPELR